MTDKRETGERQKCAEENKDILAKMQLLSRAIGIDGQKDDEYIDRLKKEGSGL